MITLALEIGGGIALAVAGFGGVRRLWRKRKDVVDVTAERTGSGHRLAITASPRHGDARAVSIDSVTDWHGIDRTEYLLPHETEIAMPLVIRAGCSDELPIILPEALQTQGGGAVIHLVWKSPNGQTDRAAFQVRPRE